MLDGLLEAQLRVNNLAEYIVSGAHKNGCLE